MSASPDISLPHFEGPLDLLLSLVRKSKVETTDIPIAEITRQYLEYLHRAEELNIDLGADFVYLAALLIHIKSRPCPPLIWRRRLLDHDQLRRGPNSFKQRLEIVEAPGPGLRLRNFPRHRKTKPRNRSRY